MRNLLNSTIITRTPVAFNSGNTGMPLPPYYRGQSVGITDAMIAAAENSANQGDPRGVEFDLGARDASSARMLDYWNLADDLLGGLPALKAGGSKYLPRFVDEEQSDYNGRLEFTEYTNVYRDIIETLASKPFEKDVDIGGAKEDADTKPPSEIEEFAKDVDGAGSTLTTFLANTFFNGINSAVDWIFVDYPVVDTSRVRTQEDQKRENIRPFWSHILGRNILEATSIIIGAKEVLARVRVLEPGSPNHVRMFERMETPTGPRVTWSLYKKNVEPTIKLQWILVDSGVISIGIIPLVPFPTGRRDGRTFYFYPPMSDAANTARELYQQESGLKFAKTMTAYPMLAANGITPPKDAKGNPLKLAVGPNKVLYGPADGAGNIGNWGYISPDAACLNFLKDDIKETMDQLRELGKQPLTAQSGNLTVITTAVAAGKAGSAVKAWGVTLGNSCNEALIITALWMNIKDFDPAVKIYDEYEDIGGDDTAALSTLQAARTARDISYDNYIIELKRRKVVRPDFDPAENTKQLLSEVPADDTEDDTDPQTGAAKTPSRPQLVKK